VAASSKKLANSTTDAGRTETQPPELWDETRWVEFVRAGGVLLIAAGIIGLVLSRLSGLLYASGTPTSAAGYLQLFSQHQFLASLDWLLWIVGDLWLIPASIAVYLALRGTRRLVAVAGTVLSLGYVIFDTCVTELDSLRIVRLAQSYAGATTDQLRAVHVALASGSVAALPILTFLSFTIGAAGWLLWSLLMTKTFFGRWSAVFGVIVNVMGILGGVGAIVQGTPLYLLGLFTIFGAIFTALWFILIGTQLYRHGTRLLRGAAS